MSDQPEAIPEDAPEIVEQPETPTPAAVEAAEAEIVATVEAILFASDSPLPAAKKTPHTQRITLLKNIKKAGLRLSP